MKTKTISEIKEKYGEIILNASIVNILYYGINTFEQTTLREQITATNEHYDELEKAKKTSMITRAFALQMLNCQFELLELEPMDILTYFSKPTKSANEEE